MIEETINKFIEQAKTFDLRTKEYKNSYNGCVMKVSFGKGQVSNVPWIAFLLGRNEIRCGIYPALLYYKNIQTIVIAFGIGSSFEPIDEWEIEEKYKTNTINKVLSGKYTGKIPYGNSFLYSQYKVNSNLDPIKLKKDLDFLIDIYKKQNG